jgi:L-rhamnose 1-dehydrogenase
MAPPRALLAGKTAAITGGTTGIGRAITLGFLRQGCNVAVNHLGLASDAGHLASLVEEARKIREADAEAGEMVDVVGDISLPETGEELVTAAVGRWGGLDVFVSNAGVCKFAEVLE